MPHTPSAVPVPLANAQRLGPPLEYLAARIGRELAPDLYSAGLDPAEVHDTVKALLAEVLAHCFRLLSGTDGRKAMISYGADDIRLEWMGPPWDCSLQLSELMRPLIFWQEGRPQRDFMALLHIHAPLETHRLPLNARWTESLERSVRHLGAVVQLIGDSGMPMLDAYRVILEREASANNMVFTYRQVCGERQLPVRREVHPGLIAQA